jgi:hypothetical protein
MRYPTKVLATSTALALAGVAAAQGAGDPSVQWGRALSDWSSEESVAALTKAASPELRTSIDKIGGSAAWVKAMDTQMGRETKVFDELSVTLNGLSIYQRLAAYERAPALMSVVVRDNAGVVVSAAAQPSSPPPAALPAGTGASVALPFAKPRQGSWFTYWGGRNLARNYHMIAPAQTYAFDFIVTRDGRSYEGPASEPASYYCWGEPVLAAGDGVVTEVANDVVDNPVGTMNPKQAAGNHVVIRHADGVHSLVGHLQRGSVKVAQGDTVKAGQAIGLCGNSGNTSEPHVHFHLQTGASFAAGGTGVAAAFRDMTVDGRKAREGEPVRGQAIVPGRR